MIEIAATPKWGDVLVEEIAAICVSVADSFPEAVQEAPVEPIFVEPSNEEFPRTLLQRDGRGYVRVLLSSRGRYFAHHAFQFAHELQHVLTNFSAAEGSWFEEVICEVSSLFALRSMSARWSTSAPYDNWRDYAPLLSRHAADRVRESESAGGADFTAWLAERIVLLEKDPYRREENCAVAARILPIFEAQPDAWRAVRYLNRSPRAAFPALFDVWKSDSPAKFHAVIDCIERSLTANLTA